MQAGYDECARPLYHNQRPEQQINKYIRCNMLAVYSPLLGYQYAFIIYGQGTRERSKP